MGKILRKTIFIAFCLLFAFQTIGGDHQKEPGVILDAMKSELARSMKILGKETMPPYFISYRVTEYKTVSISSSYGALAYNSADKSRFLDADVRVGSHQLDNTHALRGNRSDYSLNYSKTSPLPIDDSLDAIKNVLWLETDKKYKSAVERMVQIETNKNVTVKEEDESNDFSVETPQTYFSKTESVSIDSKTWENRLKQYSALFNRYPEIYNSSVSLSADAENKYLVNSEGTQLIQGKTYWQLSIFAGTKAEDGMELYKTKIFNSRTEANLPADSMIKAAVEEVIKDILALRKAPAMEPYTGPAILSGEAAAVFFHEIFGHRIEGHRQKDETEGQTFTRQIDKEVLPSFISVYDDPTLKLYENIDLNGHYLYDDEGVKAQRVDLVKNGILKNFLMSRSPIENFPRSNGHGRAQAGLSPVARQGNTIVEAHKTVPMDTLRKMLIDQCKSQSKPYGLFFKDISGGGTHTQRYSTQSFNVMPIIVYRVYVDGRPDELVRGVDLIGTPLTSFSKIIACGQTPGVFNGFCGAESGSIPASAISPAILTTQIEVQKKFKQSDKPPALPPPDRQETKADNPVFAALKDELDRSMNSLKIEKMEKPYFVEYTLLDRNALYIQGSLGALNRSETERNRYLKVGLRVGDYNFDNTAFVGSNGMSSLLFPNSGNIVLDNDYNAIRWNTWLTTDAAYKEALEQLAEKTAFMKNQVQSESIPDFSREKSLRFISPQKPADPSILKINRQKWEKLIRNLSALFLQFPSVYESRVEMEITLDEKYYINSEGTLVYRPEPLIYLAAAATTQTPDGSRLTHSIPFYAASIDEMPQEKELTEAIEKMARELNTLVGAQPIDSYIGPVLVAGQASGELFAQILAPHLSGQRALLTDTSVMPRLSPPSKLAQRMNRRVLPEDLTVVDDPTRTNFEKYTLLGSYPVDDEGVPTQPVTLIENGTLKNFLMYRLPRKDIPQSNGHGRAPFIGSAAPQIGNLFITTSNGKTPAQLKEKFLQLCKDQKLAYGIIIKTFDNPSITGMDWSMSSSVLNTGGQGDRPITVPVMIYKVNVDSGTEEPVRGITLSELTIKDLKYMAGVSNDYSLYHCQMPPGGDITGASYFYGGKSTMGIPASIISPSVLFEELEFKKLEEDKKKNPILPRPVGRR